MDPNFALPVYPEDDEPHRDLVEVPNFENEFVRAKTFLQTGSSETGENLYDHLTDVLNKILAERPENVIDFFEEYSRKVKEKRFRPQTDHLEDIYVTRTRFELAKKWQKLLRPPRPDEPSTLDPEDAEVADMSRNDLLQLLYYFEVAGFGLPRREMFAIMMSMVRLVKKEPVVSVRFWGKIFGQFKNYLVLETELKEEEYVKKNEVVQKAKDEELRLAEEAKAVEKANEEALVELPGEGNPSGIPRTLPPAPTIIYEEIPEAPDELAGIGANKKVFYVCHEAGDDWIQLPEVTAKQIRVARLIRKGFTGNLEQEVLTYPEFPGNEMNYLRAQIARISAGTQISPLGFYTFGEEGGEEEEEEEVDEEEAPSGPKTTYRENLKFEPIPIRDLVDGSMAFWVHHTLTILPQGRTTWWNPYPSEGLDEEMGEEEEDEEKPKKAGPEPETGPPLLTPLSEDSKLETVPPWSVRTSSNLIQDYAIAIVRSNIWPGAFCFANQGKIFQNVYLGNGLKRLAQNFSPKPLPDVQQEYPIGPEVMEINDPTGAEEEAWRIAHLPKVKEIKEVVGEEEEEEEEDEDDEDDDDD